MKHRTLLAIAVGAIALLACSAMSRADIRMAGGLGYANGPGLTKVRYVRKRRPMQVDIYSTRRRRGYSYSAADVINTSGRHAPPPYADVRQTPGGPFDSGYFFDSGMGTVGGNSPYLH
jgi:hypothetical protein